MINKKFLKNIKKTFEDGLQLIENKNHDYAEESDPWKNFKMAELVGVMLERAILVRVSDKLSRISNLLDKKAKVNDEKLEDTLLDCINYLAILKAYVEEKN